MTVVLGKRCSGKTTELIKMSAEKQIPIFVANASHAKIAKHMADELGLEIPEPITVGKSRLGVKSVLVDDAWSALEIILGVKVKGLSVNLGADDIEPVDVINLDERNAAK